jgi:hypothetical protein
MGVRSEQRLKLRHRCAWLTGLLLPLLVSTPALACTLCHSPQAASVRERLLAPDLWWNGCAVALPLVFLLSVVALVLREPIARKSDL